MGALCCRPEEVDFDGPVDLWHFYLLRSVGKGAFGKVRVVQHKKTKTLYALKYINKARISKQHAVNNIIQERRLLEEIDSPFVCNMRFAFQDDENLFMVLDLMLGGDLRFHLDRLGTIKEDAVRFYVAEMALALGDLHKRGIVHRDIKPDNILLDEKGHAHLTDFNIAVHFTERRALTSVAGSMAYMAPEVLSKRGYFSTVDWWSLGVVAYELLFGKRPYRGKTNSTLTEAILHDPIRFPDNVHDVVSPEGLDCIKGLLQRDPKKRLGCIHTGGLDQFKQHPWFRSYDWDVVERKEAIPPFEPDSKKANFDATHELEELLLEDNPLKARKRNPNLDVSQLSADYRAMEQHFLPYDSLRQPRKSWFVLDETSTSTSVGLSTQTGASSVATSPPPSSSHHHQHPPPPQPAQLGPAAAPQHQHGPYGQEQGQGQGLGHHPPVPLGDVSDLDATVAGGRVRDPLTSSPLPPPPVPAHDLPPPPSSSSYSTAVPSAEARLVPSPSSPGSNPAGPSSILGGVQSLAPPSSSSSSSLAAAAAAAPQSVSQGHLRSPSPSPSTASSTNRSKPLPRPTSEKGGGGAGARTISPHGQDASQSQPQSRGGAQGLRGGAVVVAASGPGVPVHAGAVAITDQPLAEFAPSGLRTSSSSSGRTSRIGTPLNGDEREREREREREVEQERDWKGGYGGREDVGGGGGRGGPESSSARGFEPDDGARGSIEGTGGPSARGRDSGDGRTAGYVNGLAR